MKELRQIKDLQERIVELEIALAASHQPRRSLPLDPFEGSPK
jgi:hypothetical protein